MELTTENILMIGSAMLIFSIIIVKAGFRFGIPSLLVFLAAGMFMGVDGLGISFSNYSTAQFIGIMSLSIILFSGGVDTNFSDIKPVLLPGVALATFGVMLTAAFTGVFIWIVASWFGLSFTLPQSLLLASVMSSTDSASVFALLRSKGLALKENLRPLLELESGSNDPMAFLLAMAAIAYINAGEFSYEGIANFGIQIAVGVLTGVAAAKIIVWVVNHINLSNQSLYSVFIFACVLFVYSVTDALRGNGYLAVYLAGLAVGNSRMIHKRNITRFFEDFTWLWQIVMFLTLGLLVNPKELLPVAGMGLAVGAFMIVFGRPLSVMLCLAPFRRFSRNAVNYVSWVGLRGAVPIVFATYLLTYEVEQAQTMFNIVFFITILSLVVQGMTVPAMARILGVDDKTPQDATAFGVELPEEIKSAMAEIEVTPEILAGGDTLSNFKLPEHTLVMMVRRGTSFFIPKGGTKLAAGDKLLVISDKDEDLKSAFEKMGVSRYTWDRRA